MKKDGCFYRQIFLAPGGMGAVEGDRWEQGPFCCEVMCILGGDLGPNTW